MRALAPGGIEEADLAFLGTDKIYEWSMSGRLAKLNVADVMPMRCGQFVLAGPERKRDELSRRIDEGDRLTVATSYPWQTRAFADFEGINLDVAATPGGSCEGYAGKGWTDLAFDVRFSGDTITENNLTVFAEGCKLAVAACCEVEFAPERSLEEDVAAIGRVLLDRVANPSEGSLTSELAQDSNKLVKKLGEEFAELLQALLRGDVNPSEVLNESADFWYVLQVALAKLDLTARDVIDEDIRRNIV